MYTNKKSAERGMRLVRWAEEGVVYELVDGLALGGVLLHCSFYEIHC